MSYDRKIFEGVEDTEIRREVRARTPTYQFYSGAELPKPPTRWHDVTMEALKEAQRKAIVEANEAQRAKIEKKTPARRRKDDCRKDCGGT
jgi:hypothetical protein